MKLEGHVVHQAAERNLFSRAVDPCYIGSLMERGTKDGT